MIKLSAIVMEKINEIIEHFLCTAESTGEALKSTFLIWWYNYSGIEHDLKFDNPNNMV